MHHRSLQRAYVEILGARLSSTTTGAPEAAAGPCSTTDVCGLTRAALTALDARIGTMFDQIGDPGSRAHLVDMRARLRVTGQSPSAVTDVTRAP
jgi:hypothetical protein